MKNVCIVGYGAIGPIHAKALEMVENAKFYAVCEIDQEKRKKCRVTYEVKEYEDFDEMLLDKNIDRTGKLRYDTGKRQINYRKRTYTGGAGV